MPGRDARPPIFFNIRGRSRWSLKPLHPERQYGRSSAKPLCGAHKTHSFDSCGVQEQRRRRPQFGTLILLKKIAASGLHGMQSCENEADLNSGGERCHGPAAATVAQIPFR